jgi:competence protein ComEC
LGVRWPWWWVWLLAMALVLLIEPWGLVRPGFWLSFSAVATLFSDRRVTEGVGKGGILQRVGCVARAVALDAGVGSSNMALF